MTEGQKYQADKVIFHEGESANKMYIIASGQVRILKENKGSVHQICLLDKGCFVGEASVFLDKDRECSAVAATTVELVPVTTHEINKVLTTCPPWVNNIMMTLSERAVEVTDLMAEHNLVDDLDGDHASALEPKEAKRIKGLLDAYKNSKNLS